MCDCHDRVATPRESSYALVSVDAAIALVLEHSQPREIITIEAYEADGFVLAESVYSPEPVPAFRASMMDGYAVVAADGIGTYPVVERIAKGDVPTTVVTSGQVSYITTGSCVPEGADAVVRVEDTQSGDNNPSRHETRVTITQSVPPGQNIRFIGSDIGLNEELLSVFQVISAVEIGLLATAGIGHVQVYRKPLVGVFSTGTELVHASPNRITCGQIRDSNRPMLLSLLRQWGVSTMDLGVFHDEKAQLHKALKAAVINHDVVITTGGVSMGEFDLIKPLLEEMGTIHFGRLLMKPGKPTTFATVTINGKKKLVFALPGNPVSAFTTCHLIVRPALKRLAGFLVENCGYPRINAQLTHSIRLDAARPEYHRARVEWGTQGFLATSTGVQLSSRLLSCRNANALLCLPTGIEMKKGAIVAAFILDTSFKNASSLVYDPKEDPFTVHVVKKVFRAGLLTISDRVAAGIMTDMSRPAMAHALQQLEQIQVNVVIDKVVPDDLDQIQNVVKDWVDSDLVDLILTSGGTGFSPRDITPEAIKALLDKDIPGFPIAMLESSLKITAKAVLSRLVAGIRKKTLIVTLPGKPTAITENLSAIASVLPHALCLVRDVPHEHHRTSM